MTAPGGDGDACVTGDREEGAADGAALVERVGELEAALREARGALERSERGRAIDVALLEAETIDLESARLLTERVMEAGEGDASRAAAEVRRRKPHLFRARGVALPSATMSARVEGDAEAPLRRAASEAAASGDRNAVLRYLRLRRSGRKR